MKSSVFNKLTSFLNYFMIFLMFFALCVIILLPKIIKWYIYINNDFYNFNSTAVYYYIIIILFIAGICSIVILNELRKMFKTCSLDNPFIKENVKSLKKISWICCIIALLFFTKIFVLNSFLTMVIVFVFIIAAIFSYVLSVLFEKAVLYKLENDLTI